MPIYKVTLAGSREDVGTVTRLTASVRVSAMHTTDAYYEALQQIRGPIEEVNHDRVTIKEVVIRGGRAAPDSNPKRRRVAGSGAVSTDSNLGSKKGRGRSKT